MLGEMEAGLRVLNVWAGEDVAEEEVVI